MPGCAQKNRPVRSVIVATVGAVDLAAPAQPREHDGDRRVGRDDHVGVVLGDRARQRPRAEQAQQPARQPADRQHVLEQPVDDRVGPREQPQLHAVAVLDDGAQHAPHRGEPVDDRDLGRARARPRSARPARARRRRGPRRRRRRGSARAAAGRRRQPGAGCVCVCGVASRELARAARGRLQRAQASAGAGVPGGRGTVTG